MDRKELRKKLLESDRIVIHDINDNLWEVETYSNANIYIDFTDPFCIKIRSTTPWNNDEWQTTVSTCRDVLVLFHIFCGF